MSIDEAIAKLDLIASDAFEGGNANEFRQLAEWLNELKELRKNKIDIYGRADAIGVGCANCIYLKTEDYTKRPCGICCYNYSSKFEEVNTDED